MDKILQDECRRRASRKLAATLLCQEFRFPTALSAEQCTSDDVAIIHAGMISQGDRMVDLTCGLGIDSFHCAGKATSVTAIELDPTVAAAIETNARALGLDNVEGICADCADWLRDNPDRHFDVAFIDPARRGDNGRRLFGLHDCKPDVIELMPLISRSADRLIVKASPMLDMTVLLRDEGLRPHSILIIGTRSECKELVLDFDFKSPAPDEPLVRVITVGKGEFSFRPSDPAPMRLADPAVGCIVGEPWPAVMKSGAYNRLPGARIHPSTHLYVLSADEAAIFPGETYRLEEITAFSSSIIKQIGRRGVDASVATRNFPISADELRRRLRARESSERRLVGVTASSGKLLLTLTR